MSDVTETLTRGGFVPSETSSRTLIVVSVYSKERMAINGVERFVSFSPTKTLVSSENEISNSTITKQLNIAGEDLLKMLREN